VMTIRIIQLEYKLETSPERWIRRNRNHNAK
jgi:hypothetical protein